MKCATLLLFVTVFSAPALAADPPKVVDLRKGVPFTGRAEATVVQVRPRVSGVLTTILVKEGEFVHKGDLLAMIDDRSYKAKFTAAKAELAVAEAQEKAAAADIARIKEALTKGVVDKREIEKAEARHEEARAKVEAAKAAVELSEINLAYTRLTAPIDGRLTRFRATVGDLVTADKTRLTEVIVDNPISVVFDVDENTALAINRAVKDGAKLNVEVGLRDEDGYPHKAEADITALTFDPKTSTVQFRARLENPKSLILHGQYVRVKVSVQPK